MGKNQISLRRFVDEMGAQISPELLALILVDALRELEKLHRRGLVHGALHAESIEIDSQGNLALLPPVDPDRSGATNEREDLHMLASTFHTLMLQIGGNGAAIRKRIGGRRLNAKREHSHIHPRLHAILDRALSQKARRRYRNSWDFASALLNHLRSMGLEGDRFFVNRFFADPSGYHRALTATLNTHVCDEVRRGLEHGRKKTAHALEELQFVLEVAPESGRALDLLNSIERRRRSRLAVAGYAAAVVLVLSIGGGVIWSKVNLSLLPKSSPLLIEPLKPERRLASDRVSAFELNETRIAVASRDAEYWPGYGQVKLDLDPDALAIFEGDSRGKKYRSDGEVVWLSAGLHGVQVLKPDFPPIIAQVLVSSDSILVLSGHVAVE